MTWAADPINFIDPLLQYGLSGLVIALFLAGWLVPKGVYESMKEERDNWRKAFETLQGAHQVSLEAGAEANRRGDAAVEAARTAAATLSALNHLSGSERA